jgi:hypothetical protein
MLIKKLFHVFLHIHVPFNVQSISTLLWDMVNKRLSILWKLIVVTLLLLLFHLSMDVSSAQYPEARYWWPNLPLLPSYSWLSKRVCNKFEYSSHVTSYNTIPSHAKYYYFLIDFLVNLRLQSSLGLIMGLWDWTSKHYVQGKSRETNDVRDVIEVSRLTTVFNEIVVMINWFFLFCLL